MNEAREPLEQALAGPAHLDDAGFTDGVLDALPPRRGARREVPLLAAGAAAALLGAVTLGEEVGAAVAALRGAGVAGTAVLLVAGAAVAAAAAAAGARVRAAR